MYFWKHFSFFPIFIFLEELLFRPPWNVTSSVVVSHKESVLTSLQNPGTNKQNLFSESVNILLTNISVPVILDIFSKLKISRYYSHLKDCKIGTINTLSSLAKEEDMLHYWQTSGQHIFISQSGVTLLLSSCSTYLKHQREMTSQSVCKSSARPPAARFPGMLWWWESQEAAGRAAAFHVVAIQGSSEH